MTKPREVRDVVSLLGYVLGTALGALVLLAAVLIPHHRRTTRSAIERYLGWGRPASVFLGVVVVAYGGIAPYLWYRLNPIFTDPVTLASGLLGLIGGVAVIGANLAATRRIKAFMAARENGPVSPGPAESWSVEAGVEVKGDRQELDQATDARAADADEKPPRKTRTAKRKKRREAPPDSAPPQPPTVIPCPACGEALGGMVARCPSCSTELEWDEPPTE